MRKPLKPTKAYFTHTRNLHGMICTSVRVEVNLSLDVSHTPFAVRKDILPTFHAQHMNHSKRRVAEARITSK